MGSSNPKENPARVCGISRIPEVAGNDNLIPRIGDARRAMTATLGALRPRTIAASGAIPDAGIALGIAAASHR